MLRFSSRWPAAALASALILTLAACASGPVPHETHETPTPAQAGTGPAPEATPIQPQPQPQPQTGLPEVVNHTPFPHLNLRTRVDGQDLYTLLLKLTYHIDEKRGLLLVNEGAEPVPDLSSPAAQDPRCMAHGSSHNQRTAWYPDTGVFVAGAALNAVHGAQGRARRLLPMTLDENGLMRVRGRQARAVEYGYMPCVGGQSVAQGVRTQGFLQPGDRLTITPAGQGPVALTLPAYMRPFVLLNYANSQARALVPGRIVLVTVDWPRRRAVVQYQITLAEHPPLAKAAWSHTMSPEYLARHPEWRRADTRIVNFLKACPSPTAPPEPCATPRRLPDLRPLP